MLNVYSRARDGETLLSRSFRAKEFACKDGTDPLFVDSELVQVLQAIRDHFGAPVVITSGYRTAAHNRAVGGAVYSQHQYGRAADIRVSGVPVEQNMVSEVGRKASRSSSLSLPPMVTQATSGAKPLTSSPSFFSRLSGISAGIATFSCPVFLNSPSMIR